LTSTEPVGPARPEPLADLPLRGSGADLFALPADSAPALPAAGIGSPGAPLSTRSVAFAADLAGTSLAVTLAVIAARAAAGRSPALSGLAWAAAFGVVYSFVSVVLPLALFGRTVGMSLAGLSARPGPSGRRLTAAEAARRWAGTALSAAGLGLPLLWTIRDPLRPTPADRFSGRPLVRDAED